MWPNSIDHLHRQFFLIPQPHPSQRHTGRLLDPPTTAQPASQPEREKLEGLGERSGHMTPGGGTPSRRLCGLPSSACAVLCCAVLYVPSPAAAWTAHSIIRARLSCVISDYPACMPGRPQPIPTLPPSCCQPSDIHYFHVFLSAAASHPVFNQGKNNQQRQGNQPAADGIPWPATGWIIMPSVLLHARRRRRRRSARLCAANNAKICPR